MANILETYPIRLYGLGIQTVSGKKSLWEQNHYIFIGNVPDTVRKEVEHIAALVNKNPKAYKKHSTILTKHYGKDWPVILGFVVQDTVQGGDDIDIFDIPNVPEKNESLTVIPQAPPREAKTTSTEKARRPTPAASLQHHVISDIRVYPEDRISEFKEKIYLATSIPPFKQHLYTVVDNVTMPMKYKIIAETLVSVDIRKIFEEKNSLLNIPIDANLFQNKESLVVEAYDSFTTLQYVYNTWGSRIYYMVDIDNFFADSMKLLRETLRTDQYQTQLLYYSMVVKFWPMITPDVFQLYINDPGEIKSVYPDLWPATGGLTRRYQAEKDALDYKYELLDDAQNKYKKYPEFRKYAPDMGISGKIQRDSLMGVSIKSAVLELMSKNTFQMNVRNLFEKISTSNTIPLVRMRLLLQNRPFIWTKIKSPSLKENDPLDIQRIYDKIKYKLQITSYNTILIVIRIAQHSPLTANGNDESSYLTFLIQDNGHYQIKVMWGEESEMEFQDTFNIIQKTVNPIIQQINDMGRPIFKNQYRIPLVEARNTEFSSLGVGIFWKNTITQSAFGLLMKKIKEEISTGIIRPFETTVGEHETEAYSFYIYKGITEYDLHQIEQNIPLWNYYEYLTNAKVKQRWQTLFEKGRLVTVTHRTTDVKFEVQDIREVEFAMFYHYLISFLYRISVDISKARIATRKSSDDDTKQNILKLAKSRDPDLYIFKRFGSDVVYSRICQKDHQPIPYTPEEYARLDSKTKAKAVQYWNFTTKSPMYYICPNCKYPYLSFIVGQHPRGYCLPCCKKTALSVAEDKAGSPNSGSKKDIIYNVCLDQHSYDEQDTPTASSRYIMNYGKAVEISRIGRLPDMLDKYLLYNLEDTDIVGDIGITTLKINGKDYDLGDVKNVLKHIKIKKKPMQEMIPYLEEPLPIEFGSNKTWLQLLKKPDINGDIYNKITNVPIEPLIMYGTTLVYNHYVLARIYRDSPEALVDVKYIKDKQLNKMQTMTMNAQTKKINRQKHKNVDSLEQALELEEAEHLKHLQSAEPEKPNENTELTTGDGEIQGGSIKKAGYYLYGVAQNNVNVMNIGAIYSIASALDMTFEEFIGKVISIFKERRRGELDYFRILLKGRLNQYFRNMDHLVAVLRRLFLGSEITLQEADTLRPHMKFTLWNELFIDIAKFCFQKYVIIADDASIDITGTSIKSSRITDNMDLILPEKITSVADIIPAPEDHVMEYILLLRKRRKAKTLFTSNYSYYPIYIFVPHEFFRFGSIKKRIFTQTDEIMKLIEQLIKSSMGENEKSTEVLLSKNAWDLNIIKEFIKDSKGITMEKILVNNKNLCYAVVLRMEKALFTIPIDYSLPHTSADQEIVENKPFWRGDSTITYEQFKEFAEQFNEFLVGKSENMGMYRITDLPEKRINALNLRELKISPLYPLMKIQKILVLDRKVIGIVVNGLYIYFREFAVTLGQLEKFFKIMGRGYNIFDMSLATGEPPQIHKLFYDPDTINKIISNPPEKKAVVPKGTSIGIDTKDFNQAIYNKFLYQLFLTEFIGWLDKERDKTMLKKITQAISRINPRKADDIQKLYNTLGDLLKDYPRDLEIIKQQINEYTSKHFDKKALLSDVQELIYDFDRRTLNKLKDLSDGYHKVSDAERNKLHKAMRDIITDVMDKITNEGVLSSPTTGDTLDNVFLTCHDNPETPFCRASRKLIIPRGKTNELADLLIADICNPLKREYLLNAVVFGNIQEYYQFDRRENEEIYVKLG